MIPWSGTGASQAGFEGRRIPHGSAIYRMRSGLWFGQDAWVLFRRGAGVFVVLATIHEGPYKVWAGDGSRRQCWA